MINDSIKIDHITNLHVNNKLNSDVLTVPIENRTWNLLKAMADPTPAKTKRRVAMNSDR